MKELAIAFLLGLAFSAPPGIVTAEAIRRGITGGFVSAAMVGIGSLIGDAVYAILALSGLAVVRGYTLVRSMIGICGAFLLFWLAFDALRAKVPTADPSSKRSDFIVGAALSLTNPWAIAFWLGFGGVLLSAGIRDPQTNLTSLLIAFLAGALTWGMILAALITVARRFVNPAFFRLVSICSALVFIGTGFYTIWQIYWDLRS